VTASCHDVRRALETESGGETGQVSAHLEACASCRSHAALLRVLRGVEPREAKPAEVARIMTALPPAPWQRRSLRAWLPLVAGLAMMALGFLALGGLPARAEMASLPSAAGAFLASLVSWGLDALAAAHGSVAAAKALAASTGAWLLVWLVLATLGGSWAVATMARRGIGARR
jgi:hypothetical protein